MHPLDPARTRSAQALNAYDSKANAEFEGADPRDQHTYMHSKLRADYALLERVGVEGARVLNVGCSFPVDEIYYCRKIARWVAVDLSYASLSVARRLVIAELSPELAARATFTCCDAALLPYAPDSFDVSVSMSTFDHLPTQEGRQAAVDEMARVTRPGGWVIVTVANRWCLPYAAGIRKMMNDRTLHYGFAYLFSPVELRRMGRQAGLVPVHFASSIGPPAVWLPGYPAYVRWPARAAFTALRLAAYFGRRVGYAFRKT